MENQRSWTELPFEVKRAVLNCKLGNEIVFEFDSSILVAGTDSAKLTSESGESTSMTATYSPSLETVSNSAAP